MAYNVVLDAGSNLYANDWDSIHNHLHFGSREGALLNFSGCFVTGDKVANSKITMVSMPTGSQDLATLQYIGSLVSYYTTYG
jgi:ethanolamine utilization microcompartment shell protein EutL